MSRLIPLLLLLSACARPTATGVDNAVAEVDLDSELPFDQGVRRGTLDNGLRWFIETNGVPHDRVVLRLVVETGSVLEDEDQLGLAHFVEHMAFNGTENFPGNSLITELEGLGTRFGPHINAHTSFDETVYKLQLPADDPAIVDTGFRILGDWAGGLTFDAEEIEAERGVVLEEWRQRLGAGKRVGDQLRPLTFHESRYNDRLPIGTEASLKGFEHEALKRFYADWYRPELMSVIVVGDIDPDEIEAKIKATFGDLANPSEPRERVRPDIPAHDETLVKVVTDPEIPVANVGVLRKMDDLEVNTHRGYRESLIEQLVITMVNMRLAELRQAEDPPFLGGGISKQRITPTEGMFAVGVAARETEAVPALRAVWTEVQRARKHGFTAGELDRAGKVILNGYERYLIEERTTQSVTHAEELIRHTTTGEPVPGIAYEVELAKAWMPGISAAECQAWLDATVREESRVITAVLPQKPGLTPPTEDELVAVLAEVDAAELEPWSEDEVLPPPVAVTPEPATIVETDTTYEESLGFTGWTLSNGVKVWFRNTEFKQDQVLMSGWRAGGHRGLDDVAYMREILSDDVKGASGIGGLTNPQLMKWLAGRSVSTRFSVGAGHDFVSVSGSPDDLDVGLSFLWQGFSDPRIDAAGRDQVLRQQRVGLENRESQPGHQMRTAMSDALWPDTPRMRPWKPAEVEAALADTDALASAFEGRFGDARGFEFAFIGNLPDGFKESVLRWIGNLPVGEADRELPDPVQIARNDGPHEIIVRANSEAKAEVGLSWHAPFEDQNWESRNRLTAVEEVLSTRLREVLREEKGGVYGVGVRTNAVPEWPIREARISVSFTCDPDRVEELKKAALEIIEDVRTQPVDVRYIDEIKAKRQRAREERLADNGFWLNNFTGALRRGEDPRAVHDYAERNASLTPEVVQRAAAKFLPQTRPDVVGMLLPAEGVE